MASWGASSELVISDSPFVYGRAKLIDSCDGLRDEWREREADKEVLDVRRYRGVILAIPCARMSLCIVLSPHVSIRSTGQGGAAAASSVNLLSRIQDKEIDVALRSFLVADNEPRMTTVLSRRKSLGRRQWQAGGNIPVGSRGIALTGE